MDEPGTSSERRFTELVESVNATHDDDPLDFIVINGDIGHGGLGPLQKAKAALDHLRMPYFVTQGNHDQVDATEWREVWGAPPNHVAHFGARSIVLPNSSNRAGEYLCADFDWMDRTLKELAGQRDVLVFMHITPNSWTRFGVDRPELRTLLANTSNLRAVFNGHDHDQNSVLVDGGVHYFFSAHFGGHWGTKGRFFREVELGDRQLATWLTPTAGDPGATITITW